MEKHVDPDPSADYAQVSRVDQETQNWSRQTHHPGTRVIVNYGVLCMKFHDLVKPWPMPREMFTVVSKSSKWLVAFLPSFKVLYQKQDLLSLLSF